MKRCNKCDNEAITESYVHELIEGHEDEGHIFLQSKQMILNAKQLKVMIDDLTELRKEVMKSNRIKRKEGRL